MPLSPRMYHWFVRPRWFTTKYIHDHILEHFRLDNKFVLDFGAGTGANCSICKPAFYLGIEPDELRVKHAKRLYPQHNFAVFDAKRVNAQDGTVDYVFIIAVLHHIPDEQINGYLQEFKRVLKPDGKIIVMEPYLCERKKWNNRFMNWYDDGEYIRSEERYLHLFQTGEYDCQVLKKFTKCFLYNELFFSAVPRRGIPPEIRPDENPVPSLEESGIPGGLVPT